MVFEVITMFGSLFASVSDAGVEVRELEQEPYKRIDYYQFQ
jgi:hypothetical protein